MATDKLSSGPVAIVGGGNMGLALASGFAETSVAGVTVIDPRADEVRGRLGKASRIVVGSGPEAVIEAPSLLVLAVKPALVPQVLPDYRGFVDAGAVVVSIAAGVRREAILAALGTDARVVRAMPNLPALVRRGATVLFDAGSLAPEARRAVETFFQAVGTAAWIDHEDLIDAATALSGSGPAFVFAFVEALAKAGAAVGLPETLAAELARATAIGAAALLQETPQPPGDLKRQVTSPGGTTAAGLKVLEGEPGLAALVEATIRAARDRATELSGG